MQGDIFPFLLLLHLLLLFFSCAFSKNIQFNSEEARVREAFLLSHYTNDPVVPESDQPPPPPPLRILSKPVTPLLHRALLSPNSSTNAVIGLAAYKSFMKGFKRLVGSLRYFNYTGQIILGVNPNIAEEEFFYLKKMNVTMYAVKMVECDESILTPGEKKNGNGTAVKKSIGGAIRGTCSKGIENLKVEMGRYEMARQWLYDCQSCDGWTLLIDTRDIFFQDDPFRSLPALPSSSPSPSSSSHERAPPVDLMFFEEIGRHTSPDPNPVRSFVAGNPRSAAHILPCYKSNKNYQFQAYHDRAVLCSGTVLGSRKGILRFLNILINEFHDNNNKRDNFKCRSPFTTDQWTMNHLYYNGRFGNINQTVTVPWGLGPILTVGKACMTAERKVGAEDLIPRDDEGWILNFYDRKISAVVHQHDRCDPWIGSLFKKYPQVFLGAESSP